MERSADQLRSRLVIEVSRRCSLKGINWSVLSLKVSRIRQWSGPKAVM